MINEAILVGRIGRKETKQVKNGGELTVLSLATTHKYKDASGEQKAVTTWHNVHCFSKLSEIATKYVHVGDLIYVRGQIQNKKIEQGEKTGQYIYSVTANDIKFLPSVKKPNQEVATPQKKLDDFPEFDDSDVPF
jgi:single-strand DNA-binding protein